MYNSTKKAQVATFSQFSRKGWSLFSCLHREVRIGVLGVATLASATPRLMAATPAQAEGSMQTGIATHADTLALGEANVSASRAPMAANVAARQVLTLTHDDLAAAGVRTINDVLKLSAGVDVRQRGGFGIQTDISIDGGTHDQITILLNGVPLVNPQTGHNAADFPVNISDIERIEILEGAASRVMGSQAFSGAINVVTRGTSATTPHLDAMVEGGSYGTVRGEARTAWQWGQGWSGTASGSYQRSDGATANSAFKGGKGFLVSSRYVPQAIGIGFLLAAVLIALLYWYFGTEQGSALRATGSNPAMSRAQGINIDRMKVIGLALSNGVVALSGGLMTQFQGTADVNMGRGAIVIGLASIVIGEVFCEAIFKKGCNFSVKLLFIVLGGVLYYMVMTLILWLRLDPNDLKLFTALIVALFLAVPYLQKQSKSSFSRAKKRGQKEAIGQ